MKDEKNRKLFGEMILELSSIDSEFRKKLIKKFEETPPSSGEEETQFFLRLKEMEESSPVQIHSSLESWVSAILSLENPKWTDDPTRRLLGFTDGSKSHLIRLTLIKGSTDEFVKFILRERRIPEKSNED